MAVVDLHADVNGAALSGLDALEILLTGRGQSSARLTPVEQRHAQKLL